MKRALAGAAAALVPFLAGAAGAVVIDFDTLPSGAAVTNQFPDATFSSDPGYENRTASDFDIATSLPNYLCTAQVAGPLDCTRPTIVDFAAPVGALSFRAGGDDDAGIGARVDVYEDGVLAGTVDVVTDGDGATSHLVDLGAFSSVTRIEIRSITDSAGLAFDDFSFDVGPVPVTATSWTAIKSLYR